MAEQIRAAIMQPYFLPYIGYWQLINAVDAFVVYDNIEYTKKGWINRNRILSNGKDDMFTLPLKKDSSYLHVSSRFLADSFKEERDRLFRRFDACYRRAPYREAGMELVRRCLFHDEQNLFGLIHHSILVVCEFLDIRTPIIVSSTLNVDPALKAESRVIATCREVGATAYINPIGGIELYDRERFREQGITLYFQKTLPYEYPQLGNSFVPHLSIIDVVMFNSKNAIKCMLGKMELI